MFVIQLSFSKEQIVEDVLKDTIKYLKSVVERYIDLISYEYIEKHREYELCFYTDNYLNIDIIGFMEKRIRLSGLIGKLEVYENRLVYGGRFNGERK